MTTRAVAGECDTRWLMRKHGHVWVVCAELEGLFGVPQRGTYELFGWVAQAEARGWLGDQVWLVPDDETLDPWMLGDAECIGQPQ